MGESVRQSGARTPQGRQLVAEVSFDVVCLKIFIEFLISGVLNCCDPHCELSLPLLGYWTCQYLLYCAALPLYSTRCSQLCDLSHQLCGHLCDFAIVTNLWHIGGSLSTTWSTFQIGPIQLVAVNCGTVLQQPCGCPCVQFLAVAISILAVATSISVAVSSSSESLLGPQGDCGIGHLWWIYICSCNQLQQCQSDPVQQ